MLREKQNELASVSVNGMKDLAGYEFPDVVVGRSDWQAIATHYLDFLQDWPEHQEVVRDKGLALDTLAASGNQVFAVRSAAQAQLMSYGSGQDDNAIGAVLTRLARRNEILAEAIISRQVEYMTEVFGRYVPKIHPISGNERCAFHHVPTGGFDGSGYVAALPREYGNLIPMFLKQLVFAEIGRAEYCLELFYERDSRQQGFLKAEPPIIMLASVNPFLHDLSTRQAIHMNTAHQSHGIFLADNIMTPYHMDAGPYTMRLRIDYVPDSAECAKFASNGAIPVVEFSANDATKLGGYISFRGISVFPPRRVVAPREIWSTSWRDRFGEEAVAKTNDAAGKCLKDTLSSRLEARLQVFESNWIAEKILDPNDARNRSLREADNNTEIDYALISHWIWSGFGDAARVDDLLARLVLGVGSGPTLISAVGSTEVDERILVAEAPEKFLEGIKKLSEVLRSEEILSAYEKSDDNFQVDQLMRRIGAMGQ